LGEWSKDVANISVEPISLVRGRQMERMRRGRRGYGYRRAGAIMGVVERTQSNFEEDIIYYPMPLCQCFVISKG